MQRAFLQQKDRINLHPSVRTMQLDERSRCFLLAANAVSEEKFRNVWYADFILTFTAPDFGWSHSLDI